MCSNYFIFSFSVSHPFWPSSLANELTSSQQLLEKSVFLLVTSLPMGFPPVILLLSWFLFSLPSKHRADFASPQPGPGLECTFPAPVFALQCDWEYSQEQLLQDMFILPCKRCCFPLCYTDQRSYFSWILFLKTILLQKLIQSWHHFLTVFLLFLFLWKLVLNVFLYIALLFLYKSAEGFQLLSFSAPSSHFTLLSYKFTCFFLFISHSSDSPL